MDLNARELKLIAHALEKEQEAIDSAIGLVIEDGLSSPELAILGRLTDRLNEVTELRKRVIGEWLSDIFPGDPTGPVQ